MEPEKLVVTSDAKAVARLYLRVFLYMIPVLLADFIYFGIIQKAIPASLFFGVLVLACAVFCYFVSCKNGRVTVTFLARDEYHGARVFIENANHQSFEVWDIPGSDCEIRQSKKQLAANRGNLHFKNTRLFCYEVNDIDLIRPFLEKHFPER